MKKSLKKCFLILLGFMCGIAFVISCGNETGTGGQIVLQTLAQAGQSLVNAIDVVFANATTNLTSNTVQEAIVELNTKVDTLQGQTPAAKTCPTGTTNIYNQFCIENDEHSNSTLPMAATACGQVNMRLCQPIEWYLTCINNPVFSNVINMINPTWEWTGLIQSNSGNSGAANVVGVGTCANTSHDANHASLRPYRCCANL